MPRESRIVFCYYPHFGREDEDYHGNYYIYRKCCWYNCYRFVAEHGGKLELIRERDEYRQSNTRIGKRKYVHLGLNFHHDGRVSSSSLVFSIQPRDQMQGSRGLP